MSKLICVKFTVGGNYNSTYDIKRQAEGIAIAKAQGKYKGRKPIEVDKGNFTIVYSDWKQGNITARQAMQQLNLKPNTFYRRVHDYEEQNDLKVAIN